MVNERLALLRDYPFRRLGTLLSGLRAPLGKEELIMSIGEPQHPYPDFVAEVLRTNAALWGKYPPTLGTKELRLAISDWLIRRYKLPDNMIDSERNILPVAGTREALFSIASMATPQDDRKYKPTILMPDPFYQIYSGAAIMAGAEPVYLPASKETGVLPSFSEVPEDLLNRASLAYVCSPSNPQGAAATIDQFERYIETAQTHDFILAVDECYSEIYYAGPLTGVLQVCKQRDGKLKNILAFHSLSKRSNVPGLRSGFVAGDARLIEAFGQLRQYTGNASPGPILAAATALWKDEQHVHANRKLYQEKFDDAETLLGEHPSFLKPDGGFYLWLNVGDGEAFTQKLWCEAGVKVMPGKYLSRDTEDASSHEYIRVALVHNRDQSAEGLRRLATLL